MAAFEISVVYKGIKKGISKNALDIAKAVCKAQGWADDKCDSMSEDDFTQQQCLEINNFFNEDGFCLFFDHVSYYDPIKFVKIGAILSTIKEVEICIQVVRPDDDAFMYFFTRDEKKVESMFSPFFNYGCKINGEKCGYFANFFPLKIFSKKSQLENSRKAIEAFDKVCEKGVIPKEQWRACNISRINDDDFDPAIQAYFYIENKDTVEKVIFGIEQTYGKYAVEEYKSKDFKFKQIFAKDSPKAFYMKNARCFELDLFDWLENVSEPTVTFCFCERDKDIFSIFNSKEYVMVDAQILLDKKSRKEFKTFVGENYDKDMTEINLTPTLKHAKTLLDKFLKKGLEKEQANRETKNALRKEFLKMFKTRKFDEKNWEMSVE